MNHRLLLVSALKETKARNPLFSMRAMAKKLSISPAHLSQLLSGQRPLTLRVALNIAEGLKISEPEKQKLVQMASLAHRRRQKKSPTTDFQYLTAEDFQPLSDWYYFAILSLAKLKKNQASAIWISKQLGINFAEAKEAYEKLKLYGYLKEKDGQFVAVLRPLHSTRDISSFEIRKYHKQNLEIAKDRIDSVPLDLRDYTSVTMALDTKKIPMAKKLIHQFKVKLSDLMENGKGDEVYTLAVQLFPLTRNTESK